MAAGLAARALRRPTLWPGCLLFHVLAAVLDCRPGGDLEGDPPLPHDLLEEHVDPWVVLMPSSEKSFAASSLVCLSMRTVTLTVSMRTSLSCVRHAAIVRAAGAVSRESVMALRISVTWRLEHAVTCSHIQRWHP